MLKKKIILERSEENISHEIKNFQVALKGPKVIGTVCLYIYNQQLSEIRSLAVHPHYQGMGIGKDLIDAVLKEARILKIHKIFTLTVEIPFFEKQDFEIIDREHLPEKIWRDCIHCPVFPDCKETAMVKEIF